MTPEEARMIRDELKMSREELLMVILALKKKATEEEAYRIENADIIKTMSKEYQSLQSEAESLRAENAELKAALAHTSEVSQLRANDIFGRGTEKLCDIIDAEPVLTETDEADKESEESTGRTSGGCHQRHASRAGATPGNGCKKAGKREEDLSKLPQKHIFRLDVEALNKQYGEGNWRIAFWHPHRTVEKTPSPVYVRNVYTPVISVGLEHMLVTVPYEAPIRQWSIASPSIMADILYNKYALDIPLHRQERMFADFGATLSRQTMCNWVCYVSFTFFGPVCDYFIQKQLEVGYHQCDETTIQVNRDGRAAGRKSYMWLHATSELAGVDPIIVFCFELTRETEHLRKFYNDFRGYITCDAYCSYQVLAKENEGVILICGCMMHMRRRFVESLSLVDKDGLDEQAIAELPETKALILIGKIYAADEQLKTLNADERKTRREAEVSPLVDEYFQYIESLDTSDPMMGERLKDAINYSINQKEYLSRFLSDGHIPIDNGFAERSIRSLAIGRRNFLFCDSVDGAKATAIMYSIVETARANKVNVYWYLRYVLEKMPHGTDQADQTQLDQLMPWSDAYREYEKLRTSQGPPDLVENEYSERPRHPRKKKAVADIRETKIA